MEKKRLYGGTRCYQKYAPGVRSNRQIRRKLFRATKHLRCCMSTRTTGKRLANISLSTSRFRIRFINVVGRWLKQQLIFLVWIATQNTRRHEKKISIQRASRMPGASVRPTLISSISRSMDSPSFISIVTWTGTWTGTFSAQLNKTSARFAPCNTPHVSYDSLGFAPLTLTDQNSQPSLPVLRYKMVLPSGVNAASNARLPGSVSDVSC